MTDGLNGESGSGYPRQDSGSESSGTSSGAPWKLVTHWSFKHDPSRTRVGCTQTAAPEQEVEQSVNVAVSSSSSSMVTQRPCEVSQYRNAPFPSQSSSNPSRSASSRLSQNAVPDVAWQKPNTQSSPVPPSHSLSSEQAVPVSRQ